MRKSIKGESGNPGLTVRQRAKIDGISISGIYKRDRREKLRSSNTEISDLRNSISSLADIVELQSRALQSLIAQQTKTEITRTEIAAPNPAKERIRVKAVSIAIPENRQIVSNPLGAAGPYLGAVFGTHRVSQPTILAPASSKHIRVLFIGDSHFHPGLPQTLRCMSLVGHHAATTKPEVIVHIGDGSDWNSACAHVRNDTWKARLKPSLRQDLDNFRENWSALNAAMDAAGVTSIRHYCMGNHDAWLERLEDEKPELAGLATGERDRILEEAGWSHSEYGALAFVGGVAATHVPLNIMGRPAGGVTPEVSISNQVTHDIVFGHTHRYNQVVRAKLGHANKVTVLNVGSSMPEFYVGDFAHHTAGSASSYGICDVDIFDGHIQGHRFVTMRELEKRYGGLV